MLTHERRLRQERDITRVYRKGRYGASLHLQVKTLASGLAGSRVAVVVSKKISKRAVIRNRIKRRIMAQVGLAWQTVRPGCDIVITVKADVSQLPTPELTQEILGALGKSEALIETTKGRHV